MDGQTAAALVKRQRLFFERGATRSLEFRCEQLRRLKDSIKMREQEALAALKSDLHKSEFESYTSEIGFCYEEINHTLKNIKRWAKPKNVGTPLILFRSKSWIQPVPKGVTLIIGPWNYPFQLIIAPLIGALAAGCTAVLKVSELAPATGDFLRSLIEDTFPADLVSVVQGGVPETTALLEERFDHIFFTGSTEVGKVVMTAAAQNLTPVTLELGGKSPCIVEKTADLQVTAKRLVWSKFYNAGQTCVAPDYLLVDPTIKDALIQEMAAAITTMYGVDPQKSREYPRIIADRHFDRLVGLLSGGRSVTGGNYDKPDRYIAPTIMDDVQESHALMREEIFGPLLPVIAYRDLEDAFAKIKERPNPLACYVFTNDPNVEARVVEEVAFGGGCINNALVHVGNPHLPFGGTGQSGIGSYHGKDSFDTFSHRKAMTKTYFWPDAALKYPPYEGRLALIKRVLK